MINNGNDNVVMFRAPSGPCLLINTCHAGDSGGLLLRKLCHLCMSTATNSSLHCYHRSLPLKAGKWRSRCPKVSIHIIQDFENWMHKHICIWALPPTRFHIPFLFRTLEKARINTKYVESQRRSLRAHCPLVENCLYSDSIYVKTLIRALTISRNVGRK